MCVVVGRYVIVNQTAEISLWVYYVLQYSFICYDHWSSWVDMQKEKYPHKNINTFIVKFMPIKEILVIKIENKYKLELIHLYLLLSCYFFLVFK